MPSQNPEIIGYIGPMKSGKSAKLIQVINKAETLGMHTLAFYPDIDLRCQNMTIQSRCGTRHPAYPTPCDQPQAILDVISQERSRVHLITFDETQFFSPDYAECILELADSGIKVVYGGLHQNFRGEMFPVIRKLLSHSSQVHTLFARCDFSPNGHPCHQPASRTQRLINGQPAPYDSPIIVIDQPGTEITYEARCHHHWSVPGLPPSRRF